MQAHTLFDLNAYLALGLNTTGLQTSPIDLLSPCHLMLDATVHVESGVTPCEGYPNWVAFTGRIMQNVAQVTHVFSFFFL